MSTDRVNIEQILKNIDPSFSISEEAVNTLRKVSGQSAIDLSQIESLLRGAIQCEYKNAKPIDFYDDIPNKYIVFSNFYRPEHLLIDGQEWPTTEHYFHAMKFLKDVDDIHHKEYREIIRQSNTPYKSKQLGNQRATGYQVSQPLNKTDKRNLGDLIKKYKPNVSLIDKWDSIRDNVMYIAVKEKFTQNKKLKDLLLSTKGFVLREASTRDGYWGTDKDGSGKNMLGNILMKVRDELLEDSKPLSYYKQLTKDFSVFTPEKGTGKQLTESDVNKLLQQKSFLVKKITDTCILQAISNDKKLNRIGIIKFYRGEDSEIGYYFDDVVYKWDDFRLEKEHDFIKLLFPHKTTEEFKTDQILRKNVYKMTVRMLKFFGLKIKQDFSIKIIKPLNRQENGITVGIYSENNYRIITLIMSFLNSIEMRFVSMLFFLAICYAMKSDPILSKNIVDYGIIHQWLKTQKFLKPYISIHDDNIFLH